MTPLIYLVLFALVAREASKGADRVTDLMFVVLGFAVFAEIMVAIL